MLTPQALGDLEAITEFIARDSPHYASLFVLDALAAVQRLERFPKSG
jgi:plasmid stabilization system protein ParE